MQIARRKICQWGSLALAGAALAPSWPAARRGWACWLDGGDDPRGNRRGWDSLGLVPLRAADLCKKDEPHWLAIPAEARLDGALATRLALRLKRRGGALLWEAPALAGGPGMEVWQELADCATLPPRNLFSVPDASPYLRMRHHGRSWWLRHDSEALGMTPAASGAGEPVLTGDDGIVYGWARNWGKGRVACLGTRLGAPAARGEAASGEFVRLFLARA